MKKIIICFLSLILVCSFLPFTGAATDGAFHWYCVHVKNHVQPRVGAELSFAEELDGYYIDHSHSSPDDAEKVIYLTFDAG